MDKANYINLAYLAASILFILGLKGLTHPRTAVHGNVTGGLGMLVATVAVLFDSNVIDSVDIIIGLGIGGAVGALLAAKVQMTQMPQLVALFNGFGGIASVLVVTSELVNATDNGARTFDHAPALETVPMAATLIIGTITFWGSLVAFGKLQEYKWLSKLKLPAQASVNGLLLLGALGVSGWFVSSTGMTPTYTLIAVTTVLGVLLVTPIGGADMPVVVALLNSYSGLAAAATGFVLGNTVLIISGSLVGASGLILTSIMCKAMNRSLANVLFGGMGETAAEGPDADSVYAGKIKKTSADEVAMLFDGVSRVVIVPGYGLAVAQAQHAIRDLANLLKERDVQIEYAIHPVAGRMPGHMNVLLAEADVPYEELIEMDQINPTFDTVDVAIVVGANDVVNPVAKTDPQSPIAGMPIIDVDKARTVIVVKRSLSPGFAGIPNPLFAADNTLMFFGDGKKALLDLVAAVKES